MLIFGIANEKLHQWCFQEAFSLRLSISVYQQKARIVHRIFLQRRLYADHRVRERDLQVLIKSF